MDVVRIIAVADEALVVRFLDIGFVLAGGVDVDPDRILPAAEPVIDMGRHMDHVPGIARQRSGQPVGGRLGPLRIGPFSIRWM